MATTEKRNARAAKLLKKSGEPTLNPLDYTASLMRALNWYNTESDNKDRKRWFFEHFGKAAKFASADIHDREYRTAGVLCRLLMNGNALEESEQLHLEREFERLKAMAGQTKKVSALVGSAPKATNTPTIQDRLEEQAQQFMAKFNEMVDEYTMDRKQLPDIAALMKQHPSAPVAKKVKAKIQKTLAELQEAVSGTDKQLVEGYSNFKKVELRKLMQAYEQLDERLEQTKKIVVRKRAVKPMDLTKVVKNVKYLTEDTTLGLKSVAPVQIVGASEVWFYNVKSKKLQSYVAMDGMTLSVKGSGLVNYNTGKSFQRTVRKPETLAGLVGKSKRGYSQFFNALTTTQNEPNGRINDGTIILAVFK